MIAKGNHLIWKGFYVLQTFQQINQLLKQQNAEKVAFVVIILLRLNSLNLRTGTSHLFWNLISIEKLPTLYMQLSAAAAIRNILEKPEDSIKRDSVFTYNNSTTWIWKNRSRKTFMDMCKRGIQDFPYLQNERK